MLEKYRKLSKNGTELAEDELNELKSKSQDMRGKNGTHRFAGYC